MRLWKTVFVILIRLSCSYPEALQNIPFSKATTVRRKDVFYYEPFENENAIGKTWHNGIQVRFDGDFVMLYEGNWEIESYKQPLLKNDLGLVMKTPTAYHKIWAHFDKPFSFHHSNVLIIQYEVKFQMPLMSCGGAYVKIFPWQMTEHLNAVNHSSRHTIMFGPDVCGSKRLLHFLVDGGVVKHKRHLAPNFVQDEQSHLYTLKYYQNDSYLIYVDNALYEKGMVNATEQSKNGMTETIFSRLKAIGHVVFELYTDTPMVIFDNILVTNNCSLAEEIANLTWSLKRNLENPKTVKQLSSVHKFFARHLKNVPRLLLAIFIVQCVGQAYGEEANRQMQS